MGQECKHTNVYFKETVGANYCPDCHSLEVGGKWIPSPAKDQETREQYVQRHRRISRAFGEDWTPDTRRRD